MECERKGDRERGGRKAQKDRAIRQREVGTLWGKYTKLFSIKDAVKNEKCRKILKVSDKGKRHSDL